MKVMDFGHSDFMKKIKFSGNHKLINFWLDILNIFYSVV